MLSAARQLDKLKMWKRRLMPTTLPHVAGWEWAVYTSDNDWPGGDYFDVAPLNEKQWLVFLGDASGHGGAAAVLAAMARMVLHSCPLTSNQEREPFCPVHGWAQTPPMVASRLNQVFLENALDEQFMTAFLASWKPEAARFDFVLAGQPRPLIWRRQSAQVEIAPDHGGLPLGISPAEIYTACQISLAPGDAMVLFTDGLIEARSADGKMFGTARVAEIVRDRASEGADAVKLGLLAGLDGFLAGGTTKDDVSIIVVKRCDG